VQLRGKFGAVCWNNNDNGNLVQLQQPLNQARVASYESINKINIEIQSTGGMHESK
jgi:hypothetical protein